MNIDDLAKAELEKLGVTKKKAPEPKRTTSWETGYAPDAQYDANDWVNSPRRVRGNRPSTFYDPPPRTPRMPEGAERLRRIAKTEWELIGKYDAKLSDRGRDQIITVVCSELAKLLEAAHLDSPTTVELYPVIEKIVEDSGYWDGRQTRDILRD